MSEKKSTKKMKHQLKHKKGRPEQKVGSWSRFRTSRHRKESKSPKQKKKKKTTASESLQELGERLGRVSVASQDEPEGPRDCDTDDPSETASKLRKHAGNHQ